MEIYFRIAKWNLPRDLRKTRENDVKRNDMQNGMYHYNTLNYFDKYRITVLNHTKTIGLGSFQK